ncbi:MAG: tetratricopeptide repeat protein [Bacteriovorax sp.]|nr:tetratricopeptide repeat protein [Bacteriovorax sp.]
MKTDLSSIRFNSTQMQLTDWSLIEVTGADREAFFQGQVTNDLGAIGVKEAQVTARLNRAGKVQSFFTIAKLLDRLLILCPKELVENILADFNKFIVMDDVELKALNEKIYLNFNYFLDNENEDHLFHLSFYGINAAINTKPYSGVPATDEKELEIVRFLNGYPKWKKDVDETQFANDSFLNEIAISYKKGCFLGQETVAKIENNRGAAYYPVLLTLATDVEVPLTELYIDAKKAGVVSYQEGRYLQVNLFRDFRVDGKKIDLIIGTLELSATINYLPFFKNQKRDDVANELYHLGVDDFQSENVESAMNYMKKAIAFDPAFSDAYESIGVILGRKERYQEAIEWMDKLLTVKSSSVMAHTNKSLFLMKLGKIEEAEAEKGLATIKSFSMYGEEAKLKKAIEAEKQKKEEDINRREKMFLQVIEIDPDDTIALYGMADVAFYREDFKKAAGLLENVVVLDEKYSAAYLLLGKSLEASANLERAIQVYKKGIDVASKRGDMMPANEMQSRLNQLVVASRLA